MPAKIVHTDPDKISPLVGYFPTSFDPFKDSGDSSEVNVYQNVKRSSRFQVVVKPRGSQLCTYALGVLDKDTQALKIVPITSNKNREGVVLDIDDGALLYFDLWTMNCHAGLLKEGLKIFTDMVSEYNVERSLIFLCTNMIEELISKGQQVDVVHFTYKVGLVDGFPPVPLLKAFLKDAKKAATSILEDPNNSGRAAQLAARKEQSALRAVVKCIEEYKLEAEFPSKSLKKRLEQL
ncbi:hypothetical protein POM88_027401 [Heracleum sosnowskyi]|uniref:FRIGIDA-like protein n=1 Tax=Heracleum sosnowskyi TaxID=360622 RepID=A0AAD8MPU4_9APIA|nr:hypothetical protein POM88_027401 [Heracleum sosnowskyi]